MEEQSICVSWFGYADLADCVLRKLQLIEVIYEDVCMDVVPCQQLYVRLFLRKHHWHRSSKLSYSEIAGNLSPILSELCRQGLLINGIHDKQKI